MRLIKKGDIGWIRIEWELGSLLLAQKKIKPMESLGHNLWSCSRLNKGASSPAAKQINHLMAYMMTNQSDILACSKAGESSWKVVGRAVVFWTSISGSRVEGVDFPKMWYAWEVLWKISISCITHTNLSYLLNHIELSYPLIYIR